MTSKAKPSDDAAELRKRAETQASQDAARTPENLFSLSPEENRRVLYELRVHQIELEMQNEELRRFQVELDESRARYFDLYDLAPVGYCTLSPKGRILEINLTAAKLLNVARSALVKQLISSFILREDQDIFHMYRRHLFKTATPQSGELRMLRADTTVLLLGETGTGKELVARAVHGLSQRGNRSLIKVNCAVLQANLIENELFGHEKGAFTGAQSRHLGLFEVADGATIFLDEIGELPLELQAKLLRVLQDGELERLGSTRTIKIDTRVIAATNRNLEEAVRKGSFREDLWYRLNVFPITLPPLRDRKNDIPLLTDFYVRKIAKRMGKTIETVSAGVCAKSLSEKL